jgi:hypothetical protein
MNEIATVADMDTATVESQPASTDPHGEHEVMDFSQLCVHRYVGESSDLVNWIPRSGTMHRALSGQASLVTQSWDTQQRFCQRAAVFTSLRLLITADRFLQGHPSCEADPAAAVLMPSA